MYTLENTTTLIQSSAHFDGAQNKKRICSRVRLVQLPSSCVSWCCRQHDVPRVPQPVKGEQVLELCAPWLVAYPEPLSILHAGSWRMVHWLGFLSPHTPSPPLHTPLSQETCPKPGRIPSNHSSRCQGLKNPLPLCSEFIPGLPAPGALFLPGRP